jgi:hypothetical protein
LVSLTSKTNDGPAVSPVVLTVTGFGENSKEKLIASARATLVNDARSARHPSARVIFFIIRSILLGAGDSAQIPARLN